MRLLKDARSHTHPELHLVATEHTLMRNDGPGLLLWHHPLEVVGKFWQI